MYSPLIGFSIIGMWYAARSLGAHGRLLVWFGAASVALAFSYGFFLRWWGGTCFGYRYLCDVAGIAALLLVFVIPAAPLAFVRRGVREAAAAAAFVVLLVWSIGVQFDAERGRGCGLFRYWYSLKARPLVAEEPVTLSGARSFEPGLRFGLRVAVWRFVGLIRGIRRGGLCSVISVNAVPGAAISVVDLRNLACGVGELAQRVGDWERVFYLNARAEHSLVHDTMHVMAVAHQERNGSDRGIALIDEAQRDVPRVELSDELRRVGGFPAERCRRVRRVHAHGGYRDRRR